MSLPRSFVQFALNFFEKPLRDVREVRALGDILTDESVGVFVGSSLPGMVRSGKEEAHTCCSGNSFVLGELQTIVSCHGLHEVILFEAFEDADDLVGSFSSGWILELPEPDFPGLPVVQCEDMLGTSSSGNRINLVIAHTVLPVNDFRSFGDVDSVRNCAPSLSQGSALLVPTATMTQMLVQFAAVGLVSPYILIYRLVRYHLDTLLAAYSHYLLGTVIHKNHLIHLLPDIFLEPAWQMAATPSVGGPFLCYPRPITSVPAVAVSLNLPRDG